jgi:hypothetical protein
MLIVFHGSTQHHFLIVWAVLGLTLYLHCYVLQKFKKYCQPNLHIEIEYFSKAVVRFSKKILAMPFSLVSQVFVLYSIMKWPTLVGTFPVAKFTSGVAFSLPHLLNTTVMVRRIVV